MNLYKQILRWSLLLLPMHPHWGLRAFGANPCSGMGTTVFLANGIHNDERMAKKNLLALKEASRSALSPHKGLRYELAFIEDPGRYRHLVEAVAQRGVDDFQRFWLWIGDTEKSPDWFNGLMQKTVLNPEFLNQTVFDKITDHLELYSDAIFKGYDIILVSHSLGSFYANAALRALPDYVSTHLQPTLTDRHRENPFYPKTEEMIANIQIGTPVAETVFNSPYVNFKDDSVVGTISKLMKVLPGNIQAAGASAADVQAHSLIPSYLREPESREKIIGYMKAASERLKTPYSFFQSAATVQYEAIINGRHFPGFDATFLSGGHDIRSIDEKHNNSESLSVLSMAPCYELRPGTIEIHGQTIVTNTRERSFVAQTLLGDVGASTSVETLSIHAPPGSSTHRWRLGEIKVGPGVGKDAIQAEVRYLPKPKLISE